jgi:Ca2+-transporting ATPase
MAEPWHTLSAEATLERLDVDRELGLAPDEAARRLSEHGPNELARDDGPRPWRILWRQVAEPLVLVLLAAAVASAGLWFSGAGEGRDPLPYDALVILAIVVLNALLGFAQEYQAERAVDTLRQMTAPACTVRRGGEVREVPSAEVVPGDVMLLTAGDRVAADARLLHSASLKLDESALTGESVPASKQARALEDPDLQPADRSNTVFTGTVVTYGRGEAVVVATGMATEMGSIAGMLQAAPNDETPLQRDLARVGKQLGLLVLAICAVVAGAGALREGTWSAHVLVDMFLFGVALAVAAIPEGLPAVVTAVLALGVRRMAAQNAIVRRLPAVETLGSATVICSDKTGTLTRNRMTVREVVLGDGRRIELGAASGGDDLALRRFLTLAVLNNDAEVAAPGGAAQDERRTQGDPTEAAFLLAARELGLDAAAIRRDHPRRGEIPFSSERKRMTTVHELGGETTAVVKGAPEVLLDLCDRVRTGDGGTRPLDDETRQRITEADEALAGQARRTLAVATRTLGGAGAAATARPGAGAEADPELDPGAVERELVWEGFAGLLDPPREGAAESVAQARRAGIRTVLVTGDHLATGLAVAREVGIATAETRGMAGRELAGLSDEELAGAVRETAVFARVRPEDKVRIVRELRRQGAVVAMTGDGVNDAPALKEADIGVAMGIAGTDVAREAGDMVLADDDYSTIVGAVLEGRKIFDNLRKFIRYLLSSNAGEVLTMFAGILGAGVLGLANPEGGVFLPLTAVQILWINLVTDGAPALALGVDPGDPGLMDRPPRDPHESVIDRATWVTIAVVGLVMMAGSLWVLDAYLPGGLTEAMVGTAGAAAGGSIARARTAAFTTLVLFQMANVFNCVSPTRSLFAVSPLRNPWLLGAVGASVALHAAVVYWPPLQRAFGTVPLAPADWALAAGVAATVLAAGEAVKWLLRRVS